MTEIEKLKADIQTRKLCTMDEHMAFYNQEAESDYNLLDRIEKVIDSLTEGHVSEDLEEAARKYDRVIKIYNKHKRLVDTLGREYFKAGADWKEQQIMKDAVEGKVNYKRTLDYVKPDDSLCYWAPVNGLNVGDKVKLIIVKED